MAPKRLHGYLHMFGNPALREKIQEMLEATAPARVEPAAASIAKKTKPAAKPAPAARRRVEKAVGKTTSAKKASEAASTTRASAPTSGKSVPAKPARRSASSVSAAAKSRTSQPVTTWRGPLPNAAGGKKAKKT